MLCDQKGQATYFKLFLLSLCIGGPICIYLYWYTYMYNCTYTGIANGIVQWDFRLTVFFLYSNLPGALTNGLKYFRFCLRFRQVNRIFQKKSPRSIIYSNILQLQLYNVHCTYCTVYPKGSLKKYENLATFFTESCLFCNMYSMLPVDMWLDVSTVQYIIKVI